MNEPDVEMPFLTGGHALHLIHRPLDIRQDAQGPVQKDPPGRRHLDAALRPFKQPGPQLVLELHDLTAERGLGDVEPGGGPAEMQFFGNRDIGGQQLVFDHGVVPLMP